MFSIGEIVVVKKGSTLYDDNYYIHITKAKKYGMIIEEPVLGGDFETWLKIYMDNKKFDVCSFFVEKITT